MMATAVCPCCGSEVDRSVFVDEIELAELTDQMAFQKQTAILFLALFQAAGRTLTTTTLLDRLGAMRPGAVATQQSLRTAARRLNRALTGTPVSVVSVYGIGYRMELTDATWHWRDAKRV